VVRASTAFGSRKQPGRRPVAGQGRARLLIEGIPIRLARFVVLPSLDALRERKSRGVLESTLFAERKAI
jgi:hypothetical protein